MKISRAAGNFLLLIPQTGRSVVSDPSGAQWEVRSITAASATATVFTMGVFALLAWIKRPGAGSRPNVTRQAGRAAQETMMG